MTADVLLLNTAKTKKGISLRTNMWKGMSFF